jgi:hypothetical protein
MKREASIERSEMNRANKDSRVMEIECFQQQNINLGNVHIFTISYSLNDFWEEK